MTLLDPLFGDPEADALLTDARYIASMLEVEVALARAAAKAGMIPARSVSAIEKCADVSGYDLAALAAEAGNAGNIAIPLVRLLTECVARIDAESARYVHWGATSQDVLDTALVLQLRDATGVIVRRLAQASDAADSLAERYAGAVMPGRTWLRHATPISFGLKAAGWMAALDRARERIRESLSRALTLQLGGASGTLASLGERGGNVAAAMAAELGLAVPDLPWHAHRDRLASLACALGIATGTMGKIARDLSLLGQTEIGEAFEAASDGRGGSSTMPHKRNPVGASVVLGAAVRAPALVATMLAALTQEHERGLGGWQAEWETMPELARVTAGAARHTAEMLAGLEVDVERMRENADITGGVSLAESVSMALAKHVGKSEAHRMIEQASRLALSEHRSLSDVLAEMPDVTGHLSATEIARCLDPEHYLGSAARFLSAAREEHARSMKR
ncbi:MAG TPA: 3-carboxy-cis,cis-muconate cycloisomerase [Gemmatimonadaceae bacterium]